MKDSSMDSEAEEKLIFFYHPDHLGSTSYVTDADGNIAQHVEYIPYGEVFVEERNSQFSTNFLFNAKELDNETGLYYYGARYLDPTGARWLSVDPLFEKYVGMSPYNYCMLNPVMLVDLDGEAPQKTSVDFRLSLGIQLGANVFDCAQLELNVISVDLFSYHRVETEAEGNVTEKKIDYIGNDGGATIKSHVAGGVGLPVIGEIKAEAHNQFNTNRNRFDEDDSDADIDVDMAKISAGFKCIIGVDFEINADFIDENTFKKAWEEIKVFGREISNYLIEE